MSKNLLKEVFKHKLVRQKSVVQSRIKQEELKLSNFDSKKTYTFCDSEVKLLQILMNNL